MGAASLNIGCELEGELDSLRRELLSRFAFFSAVSLLTWYAYVALRDTGWRAHDLAPLILAAELLSLMLLRSRFPLNVDYSVLFAASFMATLPTLIVFFTLQRYFISGIATGAIKA